MNDWKEYIYYYIKRLGGSDSENAYNSLIKERDEI
jgi:hypothetical protein